MGMASPISTFLIVGMTIVVEMTGRVGVAVGESIGSGVVVSGGVVDWGTAVTARVDSSVLADSGVDMEIVARGGGFQSEAGFDNDPN
jgi:hypothetical protein